MQGIIDTEKLIQKFFPNVQNIADFCNRCPNRMLWEAIRGEDAVILSEEDVLLYLCQQSQMLVFTEPLSNFHLGLTVPCRFISNKDIVVNGEKMLKNAKVQGSSVFEIEPLYVVDIDYSWLIAVTTENTSDGSTLCARITRAE